MLSADRRSLPFAFGLRRGLCGEGGCCTYAGHGCSVAATTDLLQIDAKLEDENSLNFGSGVWTMFFPDSSIRERQSASFDMPGRDLHSSCSTSSTKWLLTAMGAKVRSPGRLRRETTSRTLKSTQSFVGDSGSVIQLAGCLQLVNILRTTSLTCFSSDPHRAA
jgi:hypothetical protein